MPVSMYRFLGITRGWEAERLFERGVRLAWTFERLYAQARRMNLHYEISMMREDYRLMRLWQSAKTISARIRVETFFRTTLEPLRKQLRTDLEGALKAFKEAERKVTELEPVSEYERAIVEEYWMTWYY